MSAFEVELYAALKSDDKFSHGIYVHPDPPTCQEDENGEDKPVDVDLRYAKRRLPLMWLSKSNYAFSTFSIVSVRDDTTKRNYKKVVFKPPGGFDFLAYTNLSVDTPHLYIKDELRDKYRIAWTPYIAFNVCPSASIQTEEGKEFASINKYYCLFDLYWQTTKGQKKKSKDAGNIEELIEWSHDLPSRTLTPLQPWWYSGTHACAFPIYQASLLHVYIFDTNIFSHLRMQEFKTLSNGEKRWVSIKPNEKYVEGLPTDNTMSLPELYAGLSCITDSQKVNINNKVEEYVINTIIDTSKKANDIKHGDLLSKTVETGNLYAKSIFWGAENSTAAGLNNHFNFSADLDITSRSVASISKHSLKYGTTCKFEEIPSELLEGPMSSRHFESVPPVKGTFAYTFGNENVSEIGVGVPLDKIKAKLSISIRDKEIVGKNFFKIIIITKVMRIIRIENGKIIVVNTI